MTCHMDRGAFKRSYLLKVYPKAQEKNRRPVFQESASVYRLGAVLFISCTL